MRAVCSGITEWLLYRVEGASNCARDQRKARRAGISITCGKRIVELSGPGIGVNPVGI